MFLLTSIKTTHWWLKTILPWYHPNMFKVTSSSPLEISTLRYQWLKLTAVYIVKWTDESPYFFILFVGLLAQTGNRIKENFKSSIFPEMLLKNGMWKMRQRLKLQTPVKVSKLHCNFINPGGTASDLSQLPFSLPHKDPSLISSRALFNQGLLSTSVYTRH